MSDADPIPLPIRSTVVDPVTAATPASSPVSASVREAARRVLAQGGHGLHLHPWQVAYLVALTEGRDGLVPPGCGVGRGWLQARLDEELARG